MEQFEAVRDGCSPEDIEKWEAAALEAEGLRLAGDETAMDMMQCKVKKGLTRLEIELRLTKKEVEDGVQGETGWLSLGMQIEESQ